MSVPLIVRALLAVVVVGASNVPSAIADQGRWTEERIGSLFPTPSADTPAGLEAGPVTVDTLDAAFAELSAFGAIAGIDTPPPARLRAMRHYDTERGAMAIVIDSEDLENTGIALAVNGLMLSRDGELQPGDDEVMGARAQLLEHGLEPLDVVAGRLGFMASSVPGGGSLLSMRIGPSGTVTMVCDYDACVADLLAMSREIRWTDVDDFASHDHQRPPAGA